MRGRSAGALAWALSIVVVATGGSVAQSPSPVVPITSADDRLADPEEGPKARVDAIWAQS